MYKLITLVNFSNKAVSQIFYRLFSVSLIQTTCLLCCCIFNTQIWYWYWSSDVSLPQTENTVSVLFANYWSKNNIFSNMRLRGLSNSTEVNNEFMVFECTFYFCICYTHIWTNITHGIWSSVKWRSRFISFHIPILTPSWSDLVVPNIVSQQDQSHIVSFLFVFFVTSPVS